MKERWEDLQAAMETMKTIKTREFFLTAAVCLLAGMVTGMLISPKKRVMIGSNNGNNNVGGLVDAEDLEEDCCGEGKEN